MSVVVPAQTKISVSVDSKDFPFERIVISTPLCKIAFSPEHAETICGAIMSAKADHGYVVDADWVLAQAKHFGSPGRVMPLTTSEPDAEAE